MDLETRIENALKEGKRVFQYKTTLNITFYAEREHSKKEALEEALDFFTNPPDDDIPGGNYSIKTTELTLEDFRK